MLLNRTQPKTSATVVYKLEQPLINITKRENFFAAYFLTRDLQPFYDPSYFNFEVSQFVVEREENGNSKIGNIPLQIKNCSLNYKLFKEKGFEKDFMQSSLQDAVCFDPKERSMVLGGKFSGNYFSNILFRFSRCKNKTESSQSQRILYNAGSPQARNASIYILQNKQDEVRERIEMDNFENNKIINFTHNNYINKINFDKYSYNKNEYYNDTIETTEQSKIIKKEELNENEFRKNTNPLKNAERTLSSSNTGNEQELWRSSHVLTPEEKINIVCKSELEISDKIRS